jgi:TatD DNase family protein
LELSKPPPIDAHAHIDPKIDKSELSDLDAFIFAVTRSLAESRTVTDRRDSSAIWGVGCHPGLGSAQNAFRREEFEDLIGQTPLVGEIGVDASSRVPLDVQRATLREIFSVLSSQSRIASIHSFRATSLVLEELQRTPISVPVLHWWLGTRKETEQAVELGCYFSINPSCVSRSDILSSIPIERMLTETDHPYGDKDQRSSVPGDVREVERLLARHHKMTQSEVRQRIWFNLSFLSRITKTMPLFPQQVRKWLESCSEAMDRNMGTGRA